MVTRLSGGQSHRRRAALVLDDGTTLTQSMAILEWLETAYLAPPSAQR